MKKTENININGIIFHIDQDAFNKLNNYLEAIKMYFSNVEVQNKVISDIESRIAEILKSKITEYKQVISIEDIDEVISIIGEPNVVAAQNGGAKTYNNSTQQLKTPKRLYRDPNNKLLGGVCGGLGAYFNVDPIWFRIIWVIVPLIFIYIIMWIVIPIAKPTDIIHDEELSPRKKLYRSSDNKIIFGICGGLGAYFNVDPIFIRIIMLVFMLIPAYLLLWAILPIAKKDFEKLEMRGVAN